MSKKTMLYLAIAVAVLGGLYLMLRSSPKLTGTKTSAPTGYAGYLTGAGALATGVSDIIDSLRGDSPSSDAAESAS